MAEPSPRYWVSFEHERDPFRNCVNDYGTAAEAAAFVADVEDVGRTEVWFGWRIDLTAATRPPNTGK